MRARAVEDIPARALIYRFSPARRGLRRLMSAGSAVVVAAATCAGACGRADVPAAGTDAPVGTDDAVPQVAEPEAAGRPPVGAHQQGSERYRQLRLETLRLMIEAAKRALPIGPFQQRIDAAARTALEDVSEAGDRMEQIAADLREAIAADDR